MELVPATFHNRGAGAAAVKVKITVTRLTDEYRDRGGETDWSADPVLSPNGAFSKVAALRFFSSGCHAGLTVAKLREDFWSRPHERQGLTLTERGLLQSRSDCFRRRLPSNRYALLGRSWPT